MNSSRVYSVVKSKLWCVKKAKIRDIKIKSLKRLFVPFEIIDVSEGQGNFWLKVAESQEKFFTLTEMENY